MTEKLETIENRIAKHDIEIARLIDRINAIASKHDKLEDKIDRILANMDEIKEEYGKIATKITFWNTIFFMMMGGMIGTIIKLLFEK